MVNAIDIKEAAAQGLYQRPLTTAVIEKHLADLGIEPEFGTHSRIRGLSGVARHLSVLGRYAGLRRGILRSLAWHAVFISSHALTMLCSRVDLEAYALHASVSPGPPGGQKVKVVIAAAMWNNPHMLVLDEPTNYLDRESLGALAGAIKDYGGGVIMITHNSGALHIDAACLCLARLQCCVVPRKSGEFD